MIYILYFILLCLGYFLGFLIRALFTRLRWGKSSCNIQKKGMLGRGIGGGLVLIVALFLQIPSLMIVVGFMWYESRSRWCIVRSFQ